MNICKSLYGMKRDEAGGILEYNKLKNEMPVEHAEHIETIDNIIGDEYDHLQEIEKMMQEMECKDLTPAGEMCIIAKEIYDRANEIEKRHLQIKGPDAEKIHKITEEIEMKVRELHSILRHFPMEEEMVEKVKIKIPEKVIEVEAGV